MILKAIRFILLCAFLFLCVPISAQDEYRAEIGAVGGGSYYLGDSNNKLLNNMQPDFGLFLRYRFNPRIATKLEWNLANIKGDGNPSFINAINAVDMTGEFNFFDLEQNPFKRYSKIYSTYIFAGLGLMTDLYDGQTVPALSFPFGVGFKVKLAKRWNLNAQWTNRLLFSDNIEGKLVEEKFVYDNPKGLNGSNVLNNDVLSTVTVGISFDFWLKQCDCKNGTNKKGSPKFKKSQH